MTKSKKPLPKVSIIIASYNHDKFISDSVLSIINQTYTNIELIVIDDGSKDDSKKILKDLQDIYGFILIFQKNHGISYTLNRGLREFATGEYVSFCASDDCFHTNKIMKQINFMRKHPEIPMVYTKIEVIDEIGAVKKKQSLLNNKNLKGGNIFKDILLQNIHLPVSYMFKKEIFDKVGYYREDIITEDYLMNLRISFNYPIGFINETLFYYRRGKHAPNDLAGNDYSFKVSFSHLLCIKEFEGTKYFKEALRYWHYRNFKIFSKFGKYKKLALKALPSSLRWFYDLRFWRSLFQLLFYWK